MSLLVWLWLTLCIAAGPWEAACQRRSSHQPQSCGSGDLRQSWVHPGTPGDSCKWSRRQYKTGVFLACQPLLRSLTEVFYKDECLCKMNLIERYCLTLQTPGQDHTSTTCRPGYWSLVNFRRYQKNVCKWQLSHLTSLTVIICVTTNVKTSDFLDSWE